MNREDELAEFLERVHKDSGYSAQDEIAAYEEMARLKEIARLAAHDQRLAHEDHITCREGFAVVSKKIDVTLEKFRLLMIADDAAKQAQDWYGEISLKRYESMRRLSAQYDTFRNASKLDEVALNS